MSDTDQDRAEQVYGAILERFRQVIPGAFAHRYSAVIPEVLAREAARAVVGLVRDEQVTRQRSEWATAQLYQAALRVTRRTGKTRRVSCPGYLSKAVERYEQEVLA